MSAAREADAHLAKARRFLEAAAAAIDHELHDPAVSNAVTAGINAKDAICLASVGATNKSRNHQEAIKELESSGTVGKGVAPVFRRLVGLKSKSQYGADGMSASQAQSAVGWAHRLVEAAGDAVARL